MDVELPSKLRAAKRFSCNILHAGLKINWVDTNFSLNLVVKNVLLLKSGKSFAYIFIVMRMYVS